MKSIILIIFILLLLTIENLPQTVYVTKSGKKYHTANCSSLSSSKIAIDLKEAVEKGYTPCKKCKPDEKLEGTTQNNLTPQNKQQIKSKNNVTSQQCEAITKSGKRCKRTAQKGSKYCWQHQK